MSALTSYGAEEGMTKAAIEKVSRRGFLASVSAGSLVLMGHVASAGTLKILSANPNSAESFDPDFFVSISPDGQVTLLAHRSEMGTGIRTGLPRVVADGIKYVE